MPQDEHLTKVHLVTGTLGGVSPANDDLRSIRLTGWIPVHSRA